MKTYNHKRKLKIPLYDLASIAAGFYIGYNEGKGIYTSETVEYLTKYGPTLFAIGMTPIILKTMNSFGKWMNKRTLKNLQDENLDINLRNGKIIKYRTMDTDAKEKIKSKIVENVANLESRLQNPQYIKPALISGTRTAIETILGYAAGRVYSQFD